MSTPIGSLSTGSAESEIGVKFDENRLSNGKIDGPAVILAYQADDKTFVSAKFAPPQASDPSAFLPMCRPHIQKPYSALHFSSY